MGLEAEGLEGVIGWAVWIFVEQSPGVRSLEHREVEMGGKN